MTRGSPLLQFCSLPVRHTPPTRKGYRDGSIAATAGTLHRLWFWAPGAQVGALQWLGLGLWQEGLQESQRCSCSLLCTLTAVEGREEVCGCRRRLEPSSGRLVPAHRRIQNLCSAQASEAHNTLLTCIATHCALSTAPRHQLQQQARRAAHGLRHSRISATHKSLFGETEEAQQAGWCSQGPLNFYSSMEPHGVPEIGCPCSLIRVPLSAVYNETWRVAASSERIPRASSQAFSRH